MDQVAAEINVLVCISYMQLNTSVVSLNLHDNALEGEGGVAIADMLMENCYITELVSRAIC